ncbi:MAG: peptidylprolyl isomerase [Mucilaginibacter sp.]
MAADAFQVNIIELWVADITSPLVHKAFCAGKVSVALAGGILWPSLWHPKLNTSADSNITIYYGGARNPDGRGFAAFGRVTKGMEMVKKIQTQKDTSQYLVKPVKIYSVSRVE